MRLSPQRGGISLSSPAKLNLFLKIQGRRPDGFHDLETIMVSLSLHDTLKFTCNTDGKVRLRCVTALRSGALIPEDERNLVYRAALLLKEKSGCQLGADVVIWKRIPSEAGLGGGSSNAAAALVALNRLWGLNWPQQELHNLAAQLGSDVNFFLDSDVAAVCTGRGEAIEPAFLKRNLHAVLIKPAQGLSTGRVFQQWACGQQTATVQLEDVVKSLRTPSGIRREEMVNDLEAPARQLNSEVDALCQLLQRESVLASGMTGSGSTCFALCHSARQARTLAGRLRHQGIGTVFVVSSGV